MVQMVQMLHLELQILAVAVEEQQMGLLVVQVVQE
jgi:hypothetical protein